MKAIFYDRKNKREVSSEELMSANLKEEYAVVDGNGLPEHTHLNATIGLDSYLRQRVIGELGYKSKECESYKNWDLWTMLNDLVFLRLED
jgi:hypothetical protein